MRRPLTTAALAAALTLLPATAMAHPSFNPNEVSAGSATDAVLVVPHGCGLHGGMPDGSDALPTIEFALQLADGVTVEPGEVDGWDTDVAGGEVTWTDAGGATTDVLEFPVSITVAPDAGPEFALAAYQQCEDDQFIRWTEGDADFPAVHLAVEGAGGGQTGNEGGGQDGDQPADHASDTMDDHDTTSDDTTSDDATDDGHDDMTDDHGDDGHGAEAGNPLPAGAQALAGEEADSSAMIVVYVVAALLVALLVAGLVAGRREH